MTKRASQGGREASRGFTLIEVMISMAILAFMMAIAWSTSTSSSQARKQFETYQQRHHGVRVAMARMVKDLESAYLSANEDQSLLERRTLFAGSNRGSVDELRFSSLGHVILWADASESEQTLISYEAASDRQDRTKTNLIRRESRRLSNVSWRQEKAEYDVLLRDISSVTFEYWDWKTSDWKTSWNSTQADGERGRLPTRVKITVKIKSPAGDEIQFVTQARLMMQEELRFFAN